MSTITVDKISKRIGEEQILAEISFRAEEGDRLCIMGPSGSGKTTLLRIMAGLMDADTGSVTGLPEKIAFVFQEDRLCENFNAVSNIRLAVGKAMSRAQIEAHLKETGLTDSMRKPVREFSGGMKRRLAIARAICFDAPLVIMDEPFKGLDAEMKKQVMDYVKAHTAGKTLIYVTHDIAEAEYLGGEIIELKK